MSDNRFKKVTKEEAEYDIALALLPFLHVIVGVEGWERAIQRKEVWCDR